MKIDFTNQTVLITGASRGIGAQIAEDFAACSARMILTATSLKSSEELLDKYGDTTQFFAVDFADPKSTSQFLHEIKKQERIDVCINNAGVLKSGNLEGISEEDWEISSDVNLKAPLFLMRAVSEVMKRNEYGRIVNISSLWAHISAPERSIYAATKSGLRGLTRAMAVELAKDNILVNDVSPGFTLTELVKENNSESKLNSVAKKVPLGRLAEPRDISSSVLFLSSKLNSYITGQSLVIDGGHSII